MSRVIGIALAVACVLVLAGCQNAFTKHYQGERCGRVKSVRSIRTDPTDARIIGKSIFLSSRRPKDSQAITTAKSVGADIVVWEAKYHGSSEKRWSAPVLLPEGVTLSDNASGKPLVNEGGFTLIPMNHVRHYYRYTATFYRSAALEAKAKKTK